jgi:hypothetical protein
MSRCSGRWPARAGRGAISCPTIRACPLLRLFVKRFDRDEAKIAELESWCRVPRRGQAKVAGLRRLYSPPDPPADAKPDKPRRPFRELPAACQIALACKDPKFREWLSQNDPLADVSTEAAAEDAIKFLCGVERKRNVQVGTMPSRSGPRSTARSRPGATTSGQRDPMSRDDLLALLEMRPPHRPHFGRVVPFPLPVPRDDLELCDYIDTLAALTGDEDYAARRRRDRGSPPTGRGSRSVNKREECRGYCLAARNLLEGRPPCPGCDYVDNSSPARMLRALDEARRAQRLRLAPSRTRES